MYDFFSPSIIEVTDFKVIFFPDLELNQLDDKGDSVGWYAVMSELLLFADFFFFHCRRL